jgi:hypothetical protein
MRQEALLLHCSFFKFEQQRLLAAIVLNFFIILGFVLSLV